MSTRAARYAAAQLKRIAKNQVRNVGPRRERMPIQPREQVRRFMEGEEQWRLDEGLVTPEQWERYMRTMQQRIMEGR